MESQWFDSYSFVLQVALVAIAWGCCHLSSYWLAQAVAKTLLPWLIGMSIVLVIFLGAKEWLPRSEWFWLDRLETEASHTEVLLKKLTPYPFIQSLGLLLVLTILNVRRPTWKPWSKRFKKALSMSAKAIAVLSVFTSFTFFATGQASIIKKATAQEKYERVKEQAKAAASLILAARITEDAKAEAKSTNDFLTAVANQVRIDMHPPFPAGLQARDGSITKNEETWRQLIRRHVGELLKARDAAPALRRMTYAIDKSRLADMISRRFTEEQIKEANEQFKKALDIFVEKGADISIDPLAKLLEPLGLPELPELPESIVHELYTSEISHLAEKATKPLADSLFRHDLVQADNALAEFSDIANRPVFDFEAVKLVTPAIGERAPELTAKEEAEKRGRERAAERAAEELNRINDPKYEPRNTARDVAKEAIGRR
jgi:hypothetical protein